jgi:hypothetical protein
MSLAEILAKVEAAQHGSMNLDVDVLDALVPAWTSEVSDELRFVSSSLDSALALVERVRPGWCKSAVDLRPEPCEAYVWERGHVGNIQGKAATPALALLAALLRALISQQEEKA